MSWTHPSKRPKLTPFPNEKESINVIDITDSSDENTEIHLDEAAKLTLEEAKLATERIVKEQAAVVEANSKVISKLEDYFLDSIGGSLGQEEELPFETFLDYIYRTEPADLRKYSVENSIKVTRLRKLHKFAYRFHTHGQITLRSKKWLRKYSLNSNEPNKSNELNEG